VCVIFSFFSYVCFPQTENELQVNMLIQLIHELENTQEKEKGNYTVILSKAEEVQKSIRVERDEFKNGVFF
jgi:hypothetical protein